MPYPPIPEAEHKRRQAAIYLALAHGATPPNSGYRPKDRPSAINVACESLGLPRNTIDSYLKDHPFPWPRPGEKVKIPAWVMRYAPGRPPVIEQIADEIEDIVDAALTPEPAELLMRGITADLAAARRRNAALEKALAEAERLRGTVLELEAQRPQPPQWMIEPRAQTGQPGIPLLQANDWHLGEVVQRDEVDGINAFDLDVADKRIRALAQRTIDLCYSHMTGPEGSRPSYPGIVVHLGGDMISGSIHEELVETNALTRLESTLFAVERTEAFLRALRREFPCVYVVATFGNHGRDGRPRAKLQAASNADFLIFKLVEKATADDPGIIWNIPRSGDAIINVAGRRLFCTHGDRLGVKGGDGIIGILGPIQRGAVKLGAQQAVMGRHFDMLAIGHWHSYMPLPRALVGNCLIGPNEYSQLVLRVPPSPPSQALTFFHPRWGITARYEVFVDEPLRSAEGMPWVSVQRQAEAA